MDTSQSIPKLLVHIHGVKPISVNETYSSGKQYVRRSINFIQFDDVVTSMLDPSSEINSISTKKVIRRHKRTATSKQVDSNSNAVSSTDLVVNANDSVTSNRP